MICFVGRQKGLFADIFKKQMSLETKSTFHSETDSFTGKTQPEVYSCQNPSGNTSGGVLLQ